MKGIKFYSISSYIPDKVVTNDDMSKIVDTNDEWIRTRTGIERRHFASDCTNVSMAVRAAEKALSQSGIDPEKLCCVVVPPLRPRYILLQSRVLFRGSLACRIM